MLLKTDTISKFGRAGKKSEDTGSYFGTDRSVAKEFRPVRTNQAVHAIAAGFQHGKGELTNTLKIRRSVINLLYKDEIEAMYA